MASSVILTGLALRYDWWTAFGLKTEWLQPFDKWGFKIAFLFTLVAVGFTLSSGWSYLRNNRHLFMNDA